MRCAPVSRDQAKYDADHVRRTTTHTENLSAHQPGDLPYDVLAGRGAGAVTVAACWGPFARVELEAAGAEHLLHCLADLPALLDRLGAR